MLFYTFENMNKGKISNVRDHTLTKQQLYLILVYKSYSVRVSKNATCVIYINIFRVNFVSYFPFIRQTIKNSVFSVKEKFYTIF